jgi:integrating conjugative element protein (TIGR03759 family)
MKLRLSLLALIIISNYAAAAGNDVVNTQTQNTITQNTTISTSHIGIAKDWQLTDEEWGHYLNLMQGPSGHYYMNLSPPEVLGINADDTEELNHYAEVSAKFQHDKLERELRFNAVFHDVAARLYSAEPLIKPFDFTPFTPISKD